MGYFLCMPSRSNPLCAPGSFAERSQSISERRRASILRLVIVAFVLLMWGGKEAFAQPGAGQPPELKKFKLTAPGLEKPSVASLSDQELIILDPTGSVTVYKRLARYDTPDQRWIAYSSREAQQVIRWPASHSGPMQIGALQDGKVEFASSRMTVQLLEERDNAGRIGGTPGDVLPQTGVVPPAMQRRLLTPSQQPQPSSSERQASMLPIPQMTPLHLAVGDSGRRQFLSWVGDDRFGLATSAQDLTSAWYVAPVGNDMFRLQQRLNNQWMAVGFDANAIQRNDPNAGRGRNGISRPSFGGGAFPRGGSFGGGGFAGAGRGFPLNLNPIHGGCEQLWRIQPYLAGGYYFESVMYPGFGLTGVPTGGLFLQPIVYDPWQIWYPQQPVIPLPTPTFRTTEQQFVPNPPLAQISVLLANNHSDDLLVLFADRRNPRAPTKIKIPRGGREIVRVDRDAGGTIVENIEVVDAFGNWVQQQYTTPVPPAVLYDLSVYEIFLQSIAIDRTGKSPNPVEDVNYQPRSIGFFLLPPGDEVQPNDVIDTFRIAQESDNPGAVRRLSERDLKGSEPSGTKDPLKDLLQQFQKQRGAF